MGESHGPVVFVYRPKKATPLERSLALMLLFFVFAVAAYAIRWQDFGVILEDPVFLFAIVVIVAAPFLIPMQMRRSRIHVDAAGMRQCTAWPWFDEVDGRRVMWDHVRSITYAADTGMLMVRSSFGLPWAIRAKDWAVDSRPEDGDPPHLVALLQDMGLMERKPGTVTAAAQFDLMSDRRTRAIVLAGAAVGLYALFDRFVQTESWAFFDAMYVAPHVAAGFVLAMATALWLRRGGKGPILDRGLVAGLAIFSAMVTVPASYVAGIRLNQWFGGPLESHVYHRDAARMNLVPDEPELPVVEYTDMARGYWCRVPASQAVNVRVRRGAFGLYQLDLDAQTEAIRRFRDGEP